MHYTSLTISILLALIQLTNGARTTKANSAILLSKVKTLTLYGDKQTSHRRVTPIPQLLCVGGNGCKHYDVDLMRCTNAGSEYDTEDVQWTCTASLPSEFKLGSTEVICEGYDNADDPYVLKGSCGVEYRLLLSEEGEAKYAGKSKSTRKPKVEHDDAIYESNQPKSLANKAWSLLFWFVFIAILCLIVYRIFNPVQDGRNPAAGNNRRGWGGGGGGHDNGFDDPPPPYSPQAPPYQPRSKPSSSRSSGGARSGPGFWSGAAAGGAAGYGAAYLQANRAAAAETERQRQQANRGSSWFGSGGSSNGRGGSSFGSGGGGSSPGPSSSRHDSSGFGGTRRR